MNAEKTEPGCDAGPTPTFVLDIQDVHPKRIPRFSTFDYDWPRQRMYFASIDFKKIIDGRVRVYLAAAGIKTIKLNNVARLYLDLRRQVAVPTVMS